MNIIFRAVCTFPLALWATAWCQESYSPFAAKSYPTQVYFGDTHLHTNMSVDAYWDGNRLSPEKAYQFARGDEIVASNGMRAKLARPLDFLVIADHGQSIGIYPALESGNRTLLRSKLGRRWYDLMQNGSQEVVFDILQTFLKSEPGEDMEVIRSDAFRRSVWEQIGVNAEKHNDPGRFTAFIGYEWTAFENYLHRVIIFNDGPEKTNQVLPFTRYDSEDPEKLWDYLSNYERKTGGEVLAIPHNGNLSKGIMFVTQQLNGEPIDQNYAKSRSRWEPLYEVTQIKGDSETHPILSPLDEFADYETWMLSIGDTMRFSAEDQSKMLNANWMRKYEYARSALKIGLDQQAKLGINPFKFGMIGSTDSHTSLATADENNFWGKMSTVEPDSGRWRPWHKDKPDSIPGWKMTASGYAAVWASENTRKSLFAAMKRKETYATTGPRMVVRFFGGWDYEKDDAFKPDLARIGYSKGVPMGGDLTAVPKGKAPSFLIRAVKDPDGANLDRVQVIKGWRSQDGELHEKIYNVALSDGRNEGPDGDAPPVGNTVNVAEASYTNSIGAPEFSVVWIDPDFDPDELAFYYLRVIEIPTPRWTAYDANFFGLEVIPEEVPMITQERAYTSPIWYSPSAM